MHFGMVFCLFAHSLSPERDKLFKARAMPLLILVVKSYSYTAFLALQAKLRLILVNFSDNHLT